MLNGMPEWYSEHLTDAEKLRLNESAYNIRKNIIRMVSMNNWGHIGGSLSQAEIMSVLYGKAARVAPGKETEETRDRIVLSKAHTSPALYSTLYEFGFMEEKLLYKYGVVDGIDGHLHKNQISAIECGGGSLGLGLNYCAGLASALKLQENYAPRVFCIVGDGELDEGENWEAALYASQYKLDNLIVIVDCNKVQAKGMVYDEVAILPIAEKFEAFGFNVIECDGHDVDRIWNAIYRSRYVNTNGKPNVIIANTVKGRGVSQCEFNYKWHTHAPEPAIANKFLEELASIYEKPYEPIEKAVKFADPGLHGIIEEA